MEYQKKSNHILIIFIIFVLLLHVLILSLLLIKFHEEALFEKHKNEYLTHIPQEQDGSDMPLPETKTKQGMPISLIEESELPKPTAMQDNSVDSKEKEKEEDKIEETIEPIEDIKTEEVSQKPEAEVVSISEIKPSTEGAAVAQTQPVPQGLKRPRRKKLAEIFSQNKPIVPNLTQRFVDGFFEGERDGQYAFSAIGTETVATEQGLKYASYLQKVALALQNSWRIKQSKLKMTVNGRVSKNVGITMRVDKTGAITAYSLTSPCGIKEIDNIVLETIEYSNPFSAIPKYLNKEYLQINFTIVVTIINNRSLFGAHS